MKRAMILKQIRPTIGFLMLSTILFGLLYPLMITLILQFYIPAKANGSLIYQDNRVIGSKLIGQPFADPKYFWSRPSATEPFGYNGAASRGSNLSCNNPLLIERVKTDLVLLSQEIPADQMIPVDLVTASASGLDPHISIAAAMVQIPRIVKIRRLDPFQEIQLRRLLDRTTEKRQGFIWGEPRVNVVALNLALDNMQDERHAKKSK